MPKKLTDMQFVLLSTASQHPDSAIDLAGYPKGAVAKKAITRLLEDRLVEEILADGTLPVWRRDDGQGAFALRITPARPGRYRDRALFTACRCAPLRVGLRAIQCRPAASDNLRSRRATSR